MSTPLPLNRLSIIPYELELRNTLDAALYRWDELKAAAEKCLSFEEKWSQERQVAPIDWSAKVREQSRIFDYVDGFLSAWARASLLFFPTGHGTLTKERGVTLRRLFAIDQTSPVNNRSLRNAWMHHDERIDILISQGRRASGQLFTRSANVTADIRENYLRIIEIDTLVVHFQDQRGTPQSVDLHQLREALQDLERKQGTAFDQLTVPADEYAT